MNVHEEFKGLNVHAIVSSGVRGLTFGLSLFMFVRGQTFTSLAFSSLKIYSFE